MSSWRTPGFSPTEDTLTAFLELLYTGTSGLRYGEMYGLRSASFDDQVQQGGSQQRSWNGAASNRWTEAGQGPRSQQQTIRPQVSAPHAPALNGPASNAWSFMDSRTATRVPDSTHQQTSRPYDPTSGPTFRPYVPAPQAGNEGRTWRSDAADHGVRASASVQGLRGAGLPSSYRPGTPELWLPNGTASTSKTVPDLPNNLLPEGPGQAGVKNGSAFPPDGSGGRHTADGKHHQKAPNRAKTPANKTDQTTGPPPGHRRTAVAKNPRFPHCTQEDCPACQNDWKSNQCLRCGWEFKDSKDQSEHLDLFGHFVDIQTHQPEYYNWKTRQWVPIQPRRRGNARQVQGRAKKNNRPSEDAGLLSKPYMENQTQLRRSWVMNKFTGRPEPNRDVVCLRCWKNFPDSRELHQHLAERRHWV